MAEDHRQTRSGHLTGSTAHGVHPLRCTGRQRTDWGNALWGVAPTGGGPFLGCPVTAMKTALDAGNVCGWTDLDAVIAAMESGNAYVNVRTNDGVNPPNTGPGDFPGGEIRGQLKLTDDE